MNPAMESPKDHIRIFGYGSLIVPRGINGRGLSRRYKESDLRVCVLKNHRRTWDAQCNGMRFFGLRHEPGVDTLGVCFDLPRADILSFMKSEGFESKSMPYDFVDVTAHMESIPQDGILTFTCVTRDPGYEHPIALYYWKYIMEAMRFHTYSGSGIAQNMVDTTDWSNFRVSGL